MSNSFTGWESELPARDGWESGASEDGAWESTLPKKQYANPLKRIGEVFGEELATGGKAILSGMSTPEPSTEALVGVGQIAAAPFVAAAKAFVGEPVSNVADYAGVPEKVAKFLGAVAENAALFATPAKLVNETMAARAGPGFSAAQKLENPVGSFRAAARVDDIAAEERTNKPPQEALQSNVMPEPDFWPTDKPGLSLDIKSKDYLKPLEENLKKVKQKTDPLPKYARSVNLERQNLPDNLKQLEVDIGKLSPKKTQTWDETGELSSKILDDYKKAAATMEKAKAGDALNAAEIDAVRTINVNAITKLQEIVKSDVPVANKQEAFARYVHDVFDTVSDASSEAGRALNIHKKEASFNSMSRAFSKLKRSLNERELAEFEKLNFENPLEVQRFVDRLGDPKIVDYIYEYWYNSILSGIPTHVVNAVSNTLWSAYALPHRGLVGGIDALISKLTGKPRQFFMSEVVPMWAGYKSGAVKGGSAALEQVRTGEVAEFATKWQEDIGGGILGAFERSPNPTLRKLAPVVTAPSRAMMAMDVWAKSIAYDAETAALAHRIGKNRGLTGTALEQFERDLRMNPTRDMMEQAKAFAKYQTFMEEPGKVGQAIMALRDAIPGGRIVVPFVRTVGNLLKRGAEFTPGVGAALMRGKPAAEIIAKQIEGSAMTLWMMDQCAKGNVTGPAPSNKAEREAFYRQGKIPWALKVGDKWYSYRRIEPFGVPMGMVAIGYDKIIHAKDDAIAGDIFSDVAKGLYSYVLDSSYVSGLTQLTDKYGGQKNMLYRTATSFVPYSSFWRSVNRAYEVVTQGSTKVRDTDSWLGAAAQVIPGLSSKVPARLNVWGDEIELEGGVFRQWLPYKMSEETNDSVETELAALEIYPKLPEPKLRVNKNDKGLTDLPDDFYREYCIHFGHKLRTRMEQTISSDGYKAISTQERKAKRLEDVYRRVQREERDIAARSYRRFMKQK